MNKDLILIGMPGCGKSTIGKLLAEQLSVGFLDLDQEIERLAGATIPEIFAQEGEEGFRRWETKAFSGAVGRGRVLATGGGIVTREENYPIAKTGMVVFLDRPLACIMEDVRTDTRPLLAEGKERLLRLHKERDGLYRTWADITVTNNESVEKVIAKILKEVKNYENYGA